MSESVRTQGLGLYTLVALVIGNMVGAGVFTTSGFALAELGAPGPVLLAWAVGGAVALCGVASYGCLARLLPVSGGEYYFLSRTVHPLAGFIAGWVSLWAGFTAAIAFVALALEAYLLPGALRDALPANTVASAAILLCASAHGVRVHHGALVQNAAVALKLVLLLGFILFAAAGSDVRDWPGVLASQGDSPRPFSAAAFAATLMWVSFSYSGFNASVYVASEVPGAVRNVPRAMLLATAAVTVLYLLLNAIFLWAPEPGDIAGREDVAAIAARALGGETLAALMRGIIALALFTSVSAMVMAGPRVYAQMAADGLLPRCLRFGGEVPRAAVFAQALLAVAVVWLAGLRELLSYLGFTLGLSTVCTVACLFILARRPLAAGVRLPGYPWAPAAFIACTLAFALLAAQRNPVEFIAALLTILSAVLVYRLGPGSGSRRLTRGRDAR